MNFLIIFFACVSLLAAGLVGTTLSVPLQAPTLVMIGFAGLFAAIKLWRMRMDANLTRLGRHPYIWLQALALVAIFYFAIRAYWSPVHDLGIEDLMLILPAGLLYLVVGYNVGGKGGIKLRESIAWVVIFILLLHVGSCFLQLKGGGGYSLSIYFSGSSRATPTHINGMYGYYGSFANFAVIAGFLCLSLGVWGRYGHGLRILITLLGMLALGLALWSQSRSAALSSCAALVVFITLVYISLEQQGGIVKAWMRRVLVSLSVLVCALVVFGGLWVFGQRGVNSLGMIFDSGVRVPLWAMAAEQWAHNIVLGAGSRSFSYECFTYWSDGLNSGELSPEFVRNEYLQLLTDYGLIGFMLIMTLLFSHLVLGLRQVCRLSEKVGENGLRCGSNAMALAIAGSCGMVAMAVHICFDYPTHLLPNLLLMICCAVWILPLPLLSHTDSGNELAVKLRGSSSCRFMAIMLSILGVVAIGLGGQELWAGLPLIKNKIAKETGAWKPEKVDHAVWIPALEESLARAPHWRRYERLGTLHYTGAMRAASLEDQERLMNLAIDSYLASLERNPHNLVAKLNLVYLYVEQKQWFKADGLYTEMSEFARARERRFRVHKKWGDMHLRWASDLMGKQASNEVEIHFAEAKRLYNASYDYALYYDVDEWIMQYTRLLIGYANFLGHENRYDEAQTLYDEAKQQGMARNMQIHTKLNFYYAKHLYAHGNYLWHQRMPEKAYDLMIKAKEALNKHQELMNGEAGEMWNRQMLEVQEMIHFFEETGISRESKSSGQ